MQSVNIVDNNLKDLKKSKLEMSILFTENGLSYSIYHREENKILSLKSFEFEKNKDYFSQISNIIAKIIDVENPYDLVQFVIAHNEQTIVPDAIFDKDNIKKYWQLNFEIKPDKELLSYYLNRAKSFIIFSLEKNIIELINNYKAKINIIPSSAYFVEFNLKRNKLVKNPELERVYVQVYENYAEIILLQNHSLRLFNTFIYKTQNDLLYHIINLYEQLKISQTNSELVLSGFVETNSLLVLNLKKFVNLVCFESQNNDYKYFYKFQDIAPHYYFYSFNFA
ncbi:MAG: DUF3822 family protein [Bacteroidales bacterium]|nr:DUF3822 family protein [Bacteroidales bacterium]MCK9499891.1 DUF3822 family protein [Bacteroidales bacterium]MDY0315290.1 DUF3822 family protein [Bacteroidales bacterium]NLB87416.1 DUF3822 family protein [Bacteroidales bacterium]